MLSLFMPITSQEKIKENNMNMLTCFLFCFLLWYRHFWRKKVKIMFDHLGSSLNYLTLFNPLGSVMDYLALFNHLGSSMNHLTFFQIILVHQ